MLQKGKTKPIIYNLWVFSVFGKSTGCPSKNAGSPGRCLETWISRSKRAWTELFQALAPIEEWITVAQCNHEIKLSVHCNIIISSFGVPPLSKNLLCLLKNTKEYWTSNSYPQNSRPNTLQDSANVKKLIVLGIQ